ncbi:MAG: PEP-CTERM sorting domain-containing protein [Chthonomonadetes bacterium]|nr:PEP-CTERM sorting domain-containing protein [Chthonomonadetes bacterium]
MIRQLLVISLLVGVLTVSTHAVTISLHSYDNAYTADAVIDGSTHWVYIGAFRLNIAGYTDPQEAWCVDLKQSVSGSAWDAVQGITLPTTLDDGRRADWAMGALWVNRPSATDAQGRAALQLAIWEALYDGYGTNPFISGRFRVDNVFNGTNRSSANSAVLAQAQSFLQAWSGLSVTNGTLFDAPLPGSGTRSQDFILTPGGNFVPQAVPEPGTLLLMSLGLLGIGRAIKRR